MNIVPNHLFHIYNRGNQGRTIFFEREHYLYFLRKIRQYIRPYCSILAYCLMPNHFHLLIYSRENTVAPALALRREEVASKIEISNFAHGIKTLLSSYTKAINKQRNLTGSLFAQNTKARQVSSERTQEDYALSCFHYIHQNPYAAGLVTDLADWEFSCFNDYAGLRNGTLCDMDLAKEHLMLEWHQFRHETMQRIPEDSLLKIW